MQNHSGIRGQNSASLHAVVVEAVVVVEIVVEVDFMEGSGGKD